MNIIILDRKLFKLRIRKDFMPNYYSGFKGLSSFGHLAQIADLGGGEAVYLSEYSGELSKQEGKFIGIALTSLKNGGGVRCFASFSAQVQDIVRRHIPAEEPGDSARKPITPSILSKLDSQPAYRTEQEEALKYLRDLLERSGKRV